MGMEYFYLSGNIFLAKKLKNFEDDLVEINLRKIKYLLFSSKNPHKSNIENFLRSFCKTPEKLNANYANLTPLGNSDVHSEGESITEFLNLWNLTNLVRQKIFFIIRIYHSYIDKLHS